MCPRKSVLNRRQPTHTGCLLEEMTITAAYIVVAYYERSHIFVYIFKEKLRNIFITHHSELVSCDRNLIHVLLTRNNGLHFLCLMEFNKEHESSDVILV